MVPGSYWPTAAKITVGACLGLLALGSLVVFREMIAPTVVAGLVVFILNIPINRLENRDLPRGLAVVIVYVLLIGLLALLWLVLGPGLQDFLFNIQKDLEELVSSLDQSSLPFLQNLSLPVIGKVELADVDLFSQFNEELRTIVINGLSSFTSYVGGLTSGLLSIIYVLVLSFWTLKDWNRLKSALANFIPEPYLTEVKELIKELNRIWSAFLRGQVLLGLVVGCTVFIVMLIVGLPNARALAVIAGVMEFLPIVGPIISGIIGVSVAVISGSTWLPISNLWFAGLVALLYVVIGQVESVYFIPRFIGRRVHLHPAVTFAVIILAALEFGVIGVLLAAPTFASIVLVVRYVWNKLWDRPGVPRITEEPADPNIAWRRLHEDKVEVVVFMLDGALTCFNERFMRRWLGLLNWFLRGQRWPQESRQRAVWQLLGGLEGFAARLYNLLLRLRMDDRRLQGLLHPWLCLAAPVDLQLREDTVTVLQGLRLKEYQLGLITIRSQNVLQSQLRTAGLPTDVFDVVVTREDLRRLPPQRDAVRQTLQQFDCPADHILLVGCSEVNLRPGRLENMKTAAVVQETRGAAGLQVENLLLQNLSELVEKLD